MSWLSIIGQQRTKQALQASLRNGRVAHAYLFSGDEGVGQDAIALELAKVLHCTVAKERFEACDRCTHCIQHATLQHPNASLIFPLPVGKNEEKGDDPLARLTESDIKLIQEEVAEKARNPYHTITIPRATGIKVNSIRSLRQKSSLAAFAEGRKVFLIFDADLMNDEASNTLLKTLEEPNEDTIIILTTHAPECLLPTIISRCQQMRLDPLTEKEIAEALTEKNGVSSAQAALIARIARGSYGRALQLIGTNLQEHRAEAVDFLRAALFKPRQELLTLIEQLTTNHERPALAEILSLLATWLRDAMLYHIGQPSMIANVDDATALEKFSSHYQRAEYHRALTSIEHAISLLEKNVYIPLILLTLALELRQAILSPSPDHPTL